MKKENHMVYQIKAAHWRNKRMNRLIQICGCDTLDDLSDAILESFEFDHDHLYLFNMENQKYGMGSYQSMAQSSENSTNIRLDQLGLYPSQKFLYLYDFGDEWMFELTVQKVAEDKEYCPPVVLKETGQLVQYPDWEEEREEEEEETDQIQISICEELTVEEILEELEDSYIEDQYETLFFHNLVKWEEVTVTSMRARIAQEVTQNPERLCHFLSNELLRYLMSITSGEDNPIPYNKCELMKLYSFGFLRLIESEYGMGIEVPGQVAHRYLEYFLVPANQKVIGKDMELQAIAEYLILHYGVIELEALYPILNYSAKRKLTYEEFVSFVHSRLHYWGLFTIAEDENGTAYITFLEEAAAGIRRQRRETEELKGITYPVYTPKHCKKAMAVGYFQEYPAFVTIQKFMMEQGRFPEEAVNEILNGLTCAVMEGRDIETVKKSIKKSYNEYGCNFTKRVQKMIEGCYQCLPCAVLKGWALEEMGQTGCIRDGMYDSLETVRKEEISNKKKRAKDADQTEDYDQLSLF